MAKKPVQGPFAISYLRFSTPEQRKGDTVRRQKGKAAEWSKRTGIPINKTITDEGASAFRSVAANLQALIKIVEAGRVPTGTYLLVESLDRISRANALEAIPVMLELISRGIIIVSLVDNQEYSKATMAANSGLLHIWLGTLIRSHDESLVKAYRLSESWKAKREKARESRAVMTRRLPSWLTVVGSRGSLKIIPDPGKVEVVHRIFELTIEGFGRRQIVRLFNSAKPPVPTLGDGKKGWQPSAVKKILSNRAVLGEVQTFQKPRGQPRVPVGEPIPDYYPPVISREDFFRAAAALRSRTKFGGRHSEQGPNLLSGLGHCAVCKARMTILNKGQPPKGGRYFTCSSFHRSAGCRNSVRWRVDQIEDAILDHGRLVNWKPVGQSSSTDITANGLRMELEDLVRRRKIVNQLVENDDSLVERSRELTRQIKRLEEQLSSLEEEAEAAEAQHSPEENRRILDGLKGQLASADPDEVAAVRTKIAQILRRSIKQIDFRMKSVEALFHPIAWNKSTVLRTPPVVLARKDAQDPSKFSASDLAFQAELSDNSEHLMREIDE